MKNRWNLEIRNLESTWVFTQTHLFNSSILFTRFLDETFRNLLVQNEPVLIGNFNSAAIKKKNKTFDRVWYKTVMVSITVLAGIAGFAMWDFLLISTDSKDLEWTVINPESLPGLEPPLYENLFSAGLVDDNFKSPLFNFAGKSSLKTSPIRDNQILLIASKYLKTLYVYQYGNQNWQYLN